MRGAPLLLLAALALMPEARARCGRERWAVKTMQDARAELVRLVPVPTTIGALVSLPRPGGVPAARSLSSRRDDAELVVYTLRNVRLVCYKLEPDGDYHLVLSDGLRTMIAEIPAAECASQAWPEIQLARSAFRAAAGSSTRRGCIPSDLVVTVSGVAFFDRVHRQTGAARNGIELHPVTQFCAGVDCLASNEDK